MSVDDSETINGSDCVVKQVHWNNKEANDCEMNEYNSINVN